MPWWCCAESHWRFRQLSEMGAYTIGKATAEATKRTPALSTNQINLSVKTPVLNTTTFMNAASIVNPAAMRTPSGLPWRQIISIHTQSPRAAAAGVHNDFRGDWDAAQYSRTAMSPALKFRELQLLPASFQHCV